MLIISIYFFAWMFCARSYEMPAVSAISLIFNLRFPIIISHIFSMLSWIVDVEGRPLQGSSSILFWPRFNTVAYFFTIVNDGAYCPLFASISLWICFAVNPFYTDTYYWFHLNHCVFWTVNITVIKFYTVRTKKWENIIRVDLCNKRSNSFIFLIFGSYGQSPIKVSRYLSNIKIRIRQ